MSILCKAGALSAVVALCAWTLPAFAERVEPPLELLYAPGNMLVAGPLVEINPVGRLVFKRKDVLSGKPKPPELIDIRVPVAILRDVRVGERYLFGYTELRPDPRQPTRLVANPDGAMMLSSIGLEPALFLDTAETRAIIRAGRSEHGRESRRLFERLLKALTGPDRALQNLAAGEFAQETEFGERLREDGGQAVVEKIVRDKAAPPAVRSLLLTVAATRPSDFGDWASNASLEIVENTPVDGYAFEAGDLDGLVLTALELLDKASVQIPPDALKRWVWSPNPLLAERSNLMQRRQSPTLARSTVQQALADPKLPEKTRKFLSDHLRRLDRIDAKSAAKKDGTG